MYYKISAYLDSGKLIREDSMRGDLKVNFGLNPLVDGADYLLGYTIEIKESRRPIEPSGGLVQ